MAAPSNDQAFNIRKMSIYSEEEEEEERNLDLSTKLNLYEDRWTIKKILTNSDTHVQQNRLLVHKDLIEEHVFPSLGRDLIQQIQSINGGILVRVWDQDLKSEHHLIFKQWNGSKGYVFINGWHSDFVIRRSLKQGDVVGMYWNKNKKRFDFCLLQRA